MALYRFQHTSTRIAEIHAQPADEIGRAAGNAQVEAPARELIQRDGEHGDLSWMNREWIKDATADFDALAGHCQRGQYHGSAAQKEVVAHPELIETGCLGRSHIANVVTNRQVVIEAQAEFHS